MSNNVKSVSIEANGGPITIETGKLAKQADGSVVVRQGDTMLLATVVSAPEAKDGVDFMPLTIDYREKYAAAGKFPGGYLKREARPSDDEILIMRLVDRALRPLFPGDYHADTQVMISLLSYDGEHQPDALAGLAASSALAMTDIPFDGPISEVRVARVDGAFKTSPTKSELDASDVDMIIAGTANDIIMLEGEMAEISEEEMIEAIKLAHVEIKIQIEAQLALAKEFGVSGEKREYCHEVHDDELKAKVFADVTEDCKNVARQGLADKAKRSELFAEILEKYLETFSEEELEEKKGLIKTYFSNAKKEAVRRVILDDRIRLDGRAFDEIRPITCDPGYLPRVHGSAVFTRGETQSLTTMTLGGDKNTQERDNAVLQYKDKFYLHYNFPPFSTGEARPIRGTSRREIGHGNLAQRALKRMVPTDFPYTIRLVSDILESNGSSSMATVCAGTLSMMDGGVPMTRPVSGIAMGLITDDQGKYAILSDILGDEDHLGDLDFKVTGTENGVTACQMDMKIDGLSYDVLAEALAQAKAGRAHILGEMLKAIPEPNADLKPTAPRMVSFEVPGDTIGGIIGPGGKIIQGIQADTGTVVSIEELENGNGLVQIISEDANGVDEAEEKVRLIAYPPKAEVGEEYTGKVKSVQSYGVFVEIVPGTDGLIHISEFAHERVQNMEDVAKEGDELTFKVVGIDPKTKKFKLSRKVLLPKPEKKEEAK